MIPVYNKNETIFTHNGLGILDEYILSPVVSEELNGLFSFEFDYPIHAAKANLLLPEVIVKAPVPELPDQLFRIMERSQTISGVLHIVAHHIFYDLAKNMIEDTFIVNRNGTQAIGQLLAHTQFSHRFTGTSNITHVDNARMVRLNPVEVLLDSDLENGFLSRWGGEIVRDNFSISMLTQRDSNNGVQIRDKKNLTGYKSDVDYSSIMTRIMPEGFDGLFLPEKYVDSPLINNYITPKIKVIKYDCVKVGVDEGEYATKELAYNVLRQLAQAEFSEHNLDKPVATYEVEFAPLENTEEYKDFIKLETVNIGDTVQVIHEEDDLNVSARMMSYQYNPMTKSYISITLGNVLPKFTDIGKDIQKVESKVTQAQEEANVALTAANGKNTNFYGPDTPTNPKLGDVWYKENGDKLEMWVYEIRGGVTQWFPLMTDLTQEEVKQAVAQAQRDTEEALNKANDSFDKAIDALNNANSVLDTVETLETKVVQTDNKLTVISSGVSSLNDRVTTAETTLTVQAGQLASKATQSTVDTLSGRITAAESVLTQTAERFDLSLSKQNKAINDLTGAGILQPNWQIGSLNTSNGMEATGSNYVRSGLLDIKSNSKFLLQTLEGQSIYGLYGTATILYYKEDKSFISYSTFGNTTTPMTVPSNARHLRIRLTTSVEPSMINCYLLPTETVNGFTDLTTLSNVVKLTATTDTLLFSVAETKSAIGVPFKVNAWQQGSLDSNGQETTATNYLRSEFISVKSGEKFIGQYRDGTSLTAYYHFYGMNLPYTDFTPITKQYAETFTSGTYTNDSIIPYLNGLNIENLTITGAAGTNPYSSSGDYLTIYKCSLDGKVAPKVLTWNGRKDTSDNIVLLYTGSAWEKIGTVTTTSNQVYEWTLTDTQQVGISGNLYVAFYSIKNGSYAGIYNMTTTPFVLNPSSDSTLIQLSTTGTSGTITAPVGTMKMRVRVNTGVKPENFEGNVYNATTREDFTKSNSIYSALLMQKDLINLRVSKNDVVNQINLSTEGILISGNKVHITGTTTIDNAVITSAMMKDLSVTNAKIADATIASAKIANIDAAKITTGTLSAARIAAGSITSDKLTVANGFITNAMIASATITAAKIADATITNAEIASLNADKITAGTLTGRTIQTASSGNRVVITGGQDSLYFYGSYTNGTVDQYIKAYNLSGLSLASIGTNKSFYVADHFVNDGCAHFNRIAPRGSNNWGIWVRDGTVGGHGGTYLESNNGNYGIHITEASLNIINNGKYTRMTDILAKCGFS